MFALCRSLKTLGVCTHIQLYSYMLLTLYGYYVMDVPEVQQVACLWVLATCAEKTSVKLQTDVWLQHFQQYRRHYWCHYWEKLGPEGRGLIHIEFVRLHYKSNRYQIGCHDGRSRANQIFNIKPDGTVSVSVHRFSCLYKCIFKYVCPECHFLGFEALGRITSVCLKLIT